MCTRFGRDLYPEGHRRLPKGIENFRRVSETPEVHRRFPNRSGDSRKRPDMFVGVLDRRMSIAANSITIALVFAVTPLLTPAAANIAADADLECASADQGITYSVEHFNLTGKTILKILVKDNYHIVLPDSSSAPVNVSTKEIVDVSPLPTTTEEMILETTTSEDLRLEDAYQIEDDSALVDDLWEDIIQELDHDDIEKIHDIIENERERHSESSPSWDEFCREAAEDDEEPVLVSDGSFHPRYEEVLGVGVYRLHAHARSWADARRVCEREGAQLAVPNSREEALALADIHNRCPHLLPTHFNDYQYLGVHDEYNEGNWETVVGHPLKDMGYVNWAFNQPDNAHHHGENCLTMNRGAAFNDVPCWTLLPFICEHI